VVPSQPSRTSVIVTALGPDRHGLLAAVATTVAACDANVDDVSQTVTGGMFTMIMFVSFDAGEVTLAGLQAALTRTGAEIGLQITVQHEDIFRFMHRI
jgi:ACT domain-containing protein